MKDFAESRREFLKTTGAIAGGFLLWPRGILAQTKERIQQSEPVVSPNESAAADYTLHIETGPVEIAPNRILSLATYNGQFPGPLLRFKEGQQATVDVYNDTDSFGATALAWPEDPDGRGRSRRGRHAIYSRAWKAAHRVHAQAGWLSLLSHSQPRGRKSSGWTVQRRSRCRVHRTEQEPGNYDREVFLVLKGIRAHLQSRRRHGHEFFVSADYASRHSNRRESPQ